MPHDPGSARTAPSAHRTQTALEHDAVRGMYERVDAEAVRVCDQVAQVLRAPADGSTELHQREARLRLLRRRLTALESAGHGLCFGRIDAADGETLRVGRLGLTADDGETPLLVDWRADAARPFYAATPVHPLGLRRRRHLTLQGRDVVSVTDEILDSSDPGPEDVVGDGPLMAALATRRTGRMREVVATLQAEQDEIVRSPHRGVLVVAGGPGTGKTVVALHRAAYVLAAVEGAAEDGVLVLGPNARFLDYISQVLPSLGENDVALSTAADLVRPAVAGAVPDQSGEGDADVARLAGRAALADLLADTLRAHQVPDAEGLVVRVAAEDVRLGPAEVAEARTRAQGTGLAHHGAREVFLEEVAGLLTDAVVADAEAALARIDAESAELTGRDLDALAAAGLAQLGLDASGGTDAAAELDPEALRAELLADPGLDRAVEPLWPRLDAASLVRTALAAIDPQGAEEVPDAVAGWDPAEREALAASARGPLTTAHLPLLDEAAELLDGPPERTYGHVVVDEAQELTPLQWRSVLRRCPGRWMTVVGDLAQAGPTAEHTTWSEVLGPDLWRRAEVRTLTVSYRTTGPILRAAQEVLARVAPGQSPGRAVRDGDEPRRTRIAHGALADALAREVAAAAAGVPGGLVGVLAADGAVAEVADALRGDALDGAERVQVVPVSQARGLEFDAVVLADPAGIESARPCGLRDLYVALTRATTALTVVEVV